MATKQTTLAALAVSLAVATMAAPLTAQRMRTLSQSATVRKVYAPIVQTANLSVVAVHKNGEQRSLGTCVAADLVVTKYSELESNTKTSKAAALTCKRGKDTFAAKLIGFDRPSDLALLRLTDAKLTPVQWQPKMPSTGAFLASPNGDKSPLGVGILANPPYLHTRAKAFLGIQFVERGQGPAKLELAVEHGAARAAGMLAGDLVTAFGDQEIASAEDLRDGIGSYQPGDKVTVKVKRDDKELTFVVMLGTNNSAPQSGQEDVWGDLSDVRSGFQQVIQHDTVLKPKDCGGPVVDLTGKVLGVNIARAGRVETLALPAKTVQQLVQKLLRPTRAK